MAELLVLSEADVASLLDVDDLMDRLEAAFVALSAGRASVPPRTAAVVERGLLGSMPGYVDGVLAAKLVSVFPGNVETAVPTHQAVVLLFDPLSGTPLALMDGTRITAVRTGASSAVAVKALALKDASVLAILGAGVQGRSHLEAVTRVRNFNDVRVASRSSGKAERLAREHPAARACATFAEAVRGADVVCCCTDSSEPVLRLEWLAPGATVTSVGASRDGPEIGSDVVGASRLVVESRTAFAPYPAGAHELAGVDPTAAAELGEVLAGAADGRRSAHELVLYKSMGHAVEDAAAAGLVYAAAISRGVGTTATL